ncbi:aminotransferase class I/II-fold pyridoxal phosphate-dependent enzyme [Pelagibius litoralis]|uniref:Aminotransferase class I/II-fold pyridoxal phosphate-dependent enzyme n=1 Tax=Pelagibius litoralis TaxID=374515 RepID=A0A967KFQ6_9PROT|nr:aminotransferase class I/II-fold pyridoxal phosphate-dependent enzyme [Pelagibius litoralis]NIA71490.1 aminotransferase class I/II-fold pyridoxal phosphate-dependent enzyme [Pelagibius litoralis]
MSLLDKYDQVSARHKRLLALGRDPFDVCMDRIVSATEAIIGGRDVILVGTNNYLGLTFDPDCIAAAADALAREGTGTTGSRIANGTYASHRELEEEIAAFLGRRSAMVFPTGYQANLGILAGLAGPKDIILLDADSHASIYDGCRLSGATLVRFRHNSPADLDKRLERLDGEAASKLVVVEGIYSMLGDQAPLDEFVDVKQRHGVELLVDEAHSLGVFGERGRGLAEAAGVEEEVDYVVGTFSKSLGAVGGFGASDNPGFERLRYTSRPYMFTASSSPSSIATVLATLEKVRSRPELRRQLWENARALYKGLMDLGFSVCAEASPIIALKMPNETAAVFMWNALLEAGVYVNLALPPGTPDGSCLLRCSLSASHTPQQVKRICEVFEQSLHALKGWQAAQSAAE